MPSAFCLQLAVHTIQSNNYTLGHCPETSYLKKNVITSSYHSSLPTKTSDYACPNIVLLGLSWSPKMPGSSLELETPKEPWSQWIQHLAKHTAASAHAPTSSAAHSPHPPTRWTHALACIWADRLSDSEGVQHAQAVSGTDREFQPSVAERSEVLVCMRSYQAFSQDPT